MAEIKIEKKKPIWPWIVLVLVILAIIYFLVFANDEDDMDDMDDTEQIDEETVWEDEETTTWDEETDTTNWNTAGDTISKTAGVSGYLTYISDTAKMGVDHEYTNNALIELMNAVQAKANEINYDISADMTLVKQDTKAIEENPSATTHVNSIKSAGTKLANILQKMQQEEFPDLSTDVQEMKTAVDNIDESVQTLQQKEQINKFFNEAADVLRKMS